MTQPAQTPTPKPQGKFRKWLGYLLKYALPLFISVGLCYLLFKNQDLGAMIDTIKRECNFFWIGVSLLFNISAMFFRAARWGIQLNGLGIHAPRRALLYAIFGTYAVNLVLPRLGEVWRSGYIAQRQNAPFTEVFGSMLADRLADTLTVLLIAVVTFMLSSNALSLYLGQHSASLAGMVSLATSPWLWLAVANVVAGFIIFMKIKVKACWVNALQKAVKELWKGFAVLVKMPRRGVWLLLTIGIWSTYFLSMWFAFKSFGFTAEIASEYGIIAVLVTFVLSSISMGVPSNGGIGPWQWAVIFALGIYGLDANRAGAFANVLLGCTTLMQISLGLVTFAGIALDRKRNL